MKKVLSLITIFVFTVSLLATNFPAEAAGGTERNARDAQILEKLQSKTQNFGLELPSTEELVSLKAQKANSKSKVSFTNGDVALENQNEKNKIYIQIFEGEETKQVLAKKINSLNELKNIDITPSAEIVEGNKDKSFYSVPYYIIVSTPKYTGSYSFDRFFINDLSQMSDDEINQILEYNKLNNLDKEIKMNFHKNDKEIENLKDGYVSTACIACVGYILRSSSTEDKWTNVAEVHSITGVTTQFTLSSSNGSTTSLQVKSVFKNGTWETSGSKSITFTDESIYPTIKNSSLTALGKVAQTKVRYLKQVWAHPNGNEYTKVSAQSAIGGTNWGSSVGGNGASWYSVESIGTPVDPGSTIFKMQSTTNTYTNSVSLSIYGGGISLNNTMMSTTQNKWKFVFDQYNGFGKYLIYGPKHNLTARN